jgi:hypothetical protein
MAAITGAFLAGLMFARTEEKEALEPRIHALAYGFFVPIFFVNIGLHADLTTLADSLVFTLALIAIAIIAKIVGAGGGARLSGFSWRESLQLGIGMVSRGEVGLIIAAVGAEIGLIGEDIFSAVLGMVIVTTLVTPPMLRAAFSGPAPEEPRQQPLAQAAAPPARSVDAMGAEETGAAVPAEQGPGRAQAADSDSSGSGPPGASSAAPGISEPAVQQHEPEPEHEPEPDIEAQESTGASAPVEQTGSEDESATSERKE